MQRPRSRTVPALIEEIAAQSPDREALVDGDRRWTWAALSEAVADTARALRAQDIHHGDRVGILAGNRAEWLITYFAAMSLGAIAAGLNTWSSARELGYQLRHAGVKILFLESRFRDRDFLALLDAARALENGLPDLAEVVSFDGPAGSTVAWSQWLATGAAAGSETVHGSSSRVGPDDVACLLYTSGSTSLPKGVPLCHGGLIDNMWAIGERQHLVPGDRLWLAVSLFWSLACVNGVFAMFTHGGTIVLQHHFEPDAALALIQQERCTIFYGTPNMALALVESPARRTSDVSSLRTGVTIGTAAQVQRVAELGVEQICNVYGLTEAYGNSAVTDAALPLEQRVATVGRALEGVEIRIVDPDSGEPQPVGAPGEIQLRGNVTPGYWQAPEQNAAAFTTDGWFRTGDLGLLDASAYLYYRGRLKEMVKTGGINVAPAEVEEILAGHSGVELAFVIGLPDERLDEAVAAVVVRRRGSDVGVEELTKLCRRSLAAYKTPRHFRFVEASALPLTTTGKLMRSRLHELFV